MTLNLITAIATAGVLAACGTSRPGDAGASAEASASGDAAAPPRPNVVLIVADDLGWADLGAYGNPFYESPNLDALAARGVRFTQAYAAAHVCSPTRASLLTGRYPARVGLTNYLVGTKTVEDSPVEPAEFLHYLPPGERTVAEVLKANGYYTGLMGKWHLGENGDSIDVSAPTEQGFDEAKGWDYGLVPVGESYEWYQIGKEDESFRLPHLSAMVTRDAGDFIDRHADTTFFLAVTHYAVHLPLQGQPELVEKYRAKPNPRPDDYHPVYAAMIEELDDSVGEILASLERNGLTDNTLVVFVSDNGGLAVGEAGDKPTVNDPLRAGKGTMYEGGIRVPMIAYWPGHFAGGRVEDRVVATTDLYPTLLASVGATDERPGVGRVIDGADVSATLAGASAPAAAERELFWHYPHFSNQGGRPRSAIRRGDYKLIENLEDGSVELYDLAADPGETTDLAAERAGLAGALVTRLREWQRETDAPMPTRKG